LRNGHIHFAVDIVARVNNVTIFDKQVEVLRDTCDTNQQQKSGEQWSE
jgi:hypothetical protein